jgi:hypothetical protein
VAEVSDLEDTLYRVGKLLISPREAFYVHLAGKYSLSLPILVYLVISFSSSSLLVKSIARVLGIPRIGFLPEVILEFSGAIGVTISVSWLILYATLIHLIARIMGHLSGKWDEVLSALAFSSVPQSLTVFSMSLSYILSSYEFLLISLILVPLTYIWSLYILIEEVSLIYDSSIGRSILISFFGPFSFIIVSILLFSIIGIPGLIIPVVSMIVIYYWREMR